MKMRFPNQLQPGASQTIKLEPGSLEQSLLQHAVDKQQQAHRELEQTIEKVAPDLAGDHGVGLVLSRATGRVIALRVEAPRPTPTAGATETRPPPSP